MVEVTAYTATARRDSGWWVVQCDQHPGAISQVARLAHAEEVHREAIAFIADVPLESVVVTVTPEVDPLVAEELAEADRLRQTANDAERRASEKRRHAAGQLAKSGMTVRDVGIVLGVNYQRAAKLIGPRSKKSTSARWLNRARKDEHHR